MKLCTISIFLIFSILWGCTLCDVIENLGQLTEQELLEYMNTGDMVKLKNEFM